MAFGGKFFSAALIISLGFIFKPCESSEEPQNIPPAPIIIANDEQPIESDKSFVENFCKLRNQVLFSNKPESNNEQFIKVLENFDLSCLTKLEKISQFIENTQRFYASTIRTSLEKKKIEKDFKDAQKEYKEQSSKKVDVQGKIEPIVKEIDKLKQDLADEEAFDINSYVDKIHNNKLNEESDDFKAKPPYIQERMREIYADLQQQSTLLAELKSDLHSIKTGLIKKKNEALEKIKAEIRKKEDDKENVHLDYLSVLGSIVKRMNGCYETKNRVFKQMQQNLNRIDSLYKNMVDEIKENNNLNELINYNEKWNFDTNLNMNVPWRSNYFALEDCNFLKNVTLKESYSSLIKEFNDNIEKQTDDNQKLILNFHINTFEKVIELIDFIENADSKIFPKGKVYKELEKINIFSNIMQFYQTNQWEKFFPNPFETIITKEIEKSFKNRTLATYQDEKIITINVKGTADKKELEKAFENYNFDAELDWTYIDRAKIFMDQVIDNALKNYMVFYGYEKKLNVFGEFFKKVIDLAPEKQQIFLKDPNKT